MTSKVNRYDTFAVTTDTRWLVLRDMFHNTIDFTELPPGTDLRRAFADGLSALERDGWQSEGASGSMVFVRRANQRRLFTLVQADPTKPIPLGHGAPQGRCHTCGADD